MCEADLASAKSHQDILPGPAPDVWTHQRKVGHLPEILQVPPVPGGDDVQSLHFRHKRPLLSVFRNACVVNVFLQGNSN